MKRIFPSYPAAIAAGALGVPLLSFGSRLIESTQSNACLLPIWGLLAFIIPVYYATYDREAAKEWRREHGFFGSIVVPASSKAMRRLYIPAWKRMAVYFVSAVASILMFKLFGVDI